MASEESGKSESRHVGGCLLLRRGTHGGKEVFSLIFELGRSDPSVVIIIQCCQAAGVTDLTGGSNMLASCGLMIT
jgi:hypothetical protein